MSEPKSIASPGPELDEIVRQIQAVTTLCALSTMEARCVFELLLQRGWRIVKVKADDSAQGSAA
ncbi:hypothetical protein CQ14_03070 [Bradyrhizobium lablabi]|uniref:Uncharacterized protein n=1 Tax=Bradyrhizobium lablabi TaxID=722472 RepID=A0A0R3N9E9_9BRAD|nr:hypothetical protein [Bradyrhizobium lablabi]KRR26483.1 hypothetical protein CQ14_03070 [Bradyrhizobium lablabi]